MKYLRFVLIILILGVSAFAYSDIFGRDDRHNPKLGTTDYELSRSVAVGVLTSLVERNKIKGFDLFADELSDFMCKDERFSNQPSLAYACTGFLVGPDLLMTAGHCSANSEEVISSSDRYCESYAWLFDYTTTVNQPAKIKSISESKLYRCKKIVYAISEEGGEHRDFALIQLDRPVTDRPYLKLSSQKVRVGESVKMIGSPLGMPLKITSSARVLENEKNQGFMLTDLDAFQGNSGSPVFNKKNKVVGILIGGTPNEVTYKDKKLGCHRYNRCDQSGKKCKIDRDGRKRNGSDVEKLFRYKDIIGEHIKFSKMRTTSADL